MPEPIVQFAFTAGEFSKTLYARTDLEKYDFGLALAYNFFVDYRGGISSRSGLEFSEELQDADLAVKIEKFEFGADIANTYVLVFQDQKVRFVQDGGYVLESAVTITGITQADPGVVTAVGHGYSTGDLVYITDVEGMTEVNGRTFVVTVLTVDTFELNEVYDSTTNIDTTAYTTYTSGGSAYRVYTVTTPYAAADLSGLVAKQRRDTVVLTHPDYAARELVRNDATDWTMSPISFESSVDSPTGVNTIPSAVGNASVGYKVTAVKGKEESLPSRMNVNQNVFNFTIAEGQVNVTWNSVDDVDHYRIYRTSLAPEPGAVIAAELSGFIGISYASAFTDANIIPDFTAVPPLGRDPLANGRIDYINITNGGSGYTQGTATVSVTGDGSGFSGYPVVDSSGEVIGVYILKPGKNYTTASVVFGNTGGGSGTGATGDATLSPIEGNNPRASVIFQQRQIFGGTDNAPLGVFGSKPGAYRNFDDSTIPTDGDAYEFDLDAERVSPIRHFVDLRSSLIAFSGSGVWNVTGGSEIAVTPLNVNGEAQTYIGIAPVAPIAIDNDILYVQKENGVVRALSYQRERDAYTGIDRSVLSNHFFTKNRIIVNWAYAQTPFYLIWAVRSDGRLLSMTYLREQEVYAWTQHETQGLFEDTTAIEEFGQNIPYFAVSRKVNTVWRKFLERMTVREGDNAEDYMCLDAGIRRGKTAQSGRIEVSAATGEVDIMVSGATPFSSGNIGDHIRVNNGMIEITAFTSSTEVTGIVRIPLTDLLPNKTPLPTEDWYMDTPSATVNGLWHLEGTSVVALANGTPVPAQTVTNGTITVPEDTSLVSAGWGFTCRAKTLPAISRSRVIEGKRRRPIGMALRVNLARGLYAGTEDSMYFVVERKNEPYDTPTALQSGIKDITLSSTYDREGSIEIAVYDPLPASILGYTLELDAGDDND